MGNKAHRYAGNPCDLYMNEYICGVLLFQTIGIVKKRESIVSSKSTSNAYRKKEK